MNIYIFLVNLIILLYQNVINYKINKGFCSWHLTVAYHKAEKQCCTALFG